VALGGDDARDALRRAAVEHFDSRAREASAAGAGIIR
jgi:hypothetical protein